jgi:hypothetical protein
MPAPLRLAVPLILLFTGSALADDGRDGAKDDAAKDNAATSRFPRIRLGGILIGAGYSHFVGPRYGYGYGGPYGFDPWFYGYGFHPGYFAGFGYGPLMGEIKLKSDDPNAWVYLDGALAGRAEKLKTMWLEPGAYRLEVRAGDRAFGQKVYVLSGKKLQLTVDLKRSEVRP